MIDSLYLGPEYDLSHIEGDTVTSMDVAKLIADRKIVAIFQGRSEAGPRALGNRSILYDPRDPEGKDRLNMVKNREPFRPFACSILLHHAHNWFDMGGLTESPFMMYAVKALPHTFDKIPAVLHVDKTCRVQTVSLGDNENYFRLIDAFYQCTKTPLVFNTSFNLSGDPLVETPEDALECFEYSMIDYLYFPEVQKLRRK
jgi:carbamoyltransferase|tara:strand:- start:449 stop:1048 length:600 start_codon:yes stop_codon:yes gene_type:complete